MKEKNLEDDVLLDEVQVFLFLLGEDDLAVGGAKLEDVGWVIMIEILFRSLSNTLLFRFDMFTNLNRFFCLSWDT
jgi:hypothetical protein